LIWTTRLFPFTDLPNHLAAATILRHFRDPACSFADYFDIELFPRPNVFHLLFCSLKLFPSVEMANRLFLSLYALLLPLSALFFTRRTGGDRWHSVASFVLLYNMSVSWGFVGFFFSIPLVLIFAGLLVGYFDRGGWRSSSALTLILAVTFFVHALAALFMLLLFITCGLVRSKGEPLGLLARLAPALPLALLLFAWWRSQPGSEGLLGFLGGYYAHDYLPRLLSRAHLAFLDNYHLFEGSAGIAIASCLSCAIIAPGIASILLAHGRSDRRELLRSVPFILFACCFACFFILPNQIPRQAILYQRFSALVLLSLVFLGASVERSGIGFLKKGVYVAAAVAHLALWSASFSALEKENEGFDASFFPEDSAGMTLAGLIFEYEYRGRPAYIHFPSYFTVWKRGITATALVDYRFGSVRRKPGGLSLPNYREWIGKTDGSGGLYSEMQLLLSRGSPPRSAAHHFWERPKIGENHPWRLYGPRD
jgi:hypothetical protein